MNKTNFRVLYVYVRFKNNDLKENNYCVATEVLSTEI